MSAVVDASATKAIAGPACQRGPPSRCMRGQRESALRYVRRVSHHGEGALLCPDLWMFPPRPLPRPLVAPAEGFIWSRTMLSQIADP